MKDAVSAYLPWLISVVTLAAIVLQGDRSSRRGWAVAFGAQGLWLAWIWASATWGYLPLTLALAAMNVRNWIKWGTVEVRGYVIADAQGWRYRCWGDSGPEWTSYVKEALLFANRSSAEAVAREDEDAWKILSVSWKDDGLSPGAGVWR